MELKNYKILNQYIQGSNSQVYRAICLSEQIQVVLKIQTKPSNSFRSQLEVLHTVREIPGFPKLKQFFIEGDLHVIVLFKLGPSLKQFFHTKNFKLKKHTIINMGLQMLERIKVLHQRLYLHCDIKPSNMLLGLKEDKRKIHLIDFGMVYKLNTASTQQKGLFRGNMLYSSYSQMDGNPPKYEDDIQSIGYILIEIIAGSLPWKGIEESNPQLLFSKIKKIKKEPSEYHKFCLLRNEWAYKFIKESRNQDRKLNYEFFQNHIKNLQVIDF